MMLFLRSYVLGAFLRDLGVSWDVSIVRTMEAKVISQVFRTASARAKQCSLVSKAWSNVNMSSLSR
jgi:hypothetical protein